MSYDDMIYMAHPISRKHKAMPMEERAAQFSPFAALMGYDEAIEEEARITDEKPEITDEKKNEISELLSYLQNHMNEVILLKYFIPDSKKEGGAFRTLHTSLKKIEDQEGYILLPDKTKIPFTDILDLRIPSLKTAEESGFSL